MFSLHLNIMLMIITIIHEYRFIITPMEKVIAFSLLYIYSHIAHGGLFEIRFKFMNPHKEFSFLVKR